MLRGENELLAYLRKNPFVLAPMAGITDRAFRSFMREMNCGVVVTELVSATGLRFQSQRTRKLMEFDSTQHPIGVQLFGEDLDSLAFAAAEVEQVGADFVDLNFGCPVPKVVKKGAGAAVLKDLASLKDILRVVKKAVTIPVTIKIRTGWDQESRNAHEVVQVAADEGITWVAIHGRTRAQGYSGRADWEYIASVKKVSPIPVLGNGDIASAEQAKKRLEESGCDGVLIGRGCLKNPWIFREALGLTKFGEKKDFSPVLESLITHLDRSCEDRITQLQIKKFASWFSAGYPESSQFRRELFQAKTRSDVIGIVESYFGRVSNFTPADTSHEAFLMGGHG